MNQFRAVFEDRLDDIYEERGVAVAYKDRDGIGLLDSCTAIVQPSLEQFVDGVDVQGITAILRVRKSEITKRPEKSSRFVDGETTYRVQEALDASELEYRLYCV